MQNAVTLGIDVSKGYADFVLLNDSKEELGKSFKLYDNQKGHQSLKDYIDKHKDSFDKMYCLVESTGGYEDNWYGMLTHHLPTEVQVVRVNPRAIKGQRTSSLTRTVTDNVSARMIAEYGIEKRKTLFGSISNTIGNGQARKFYHYINSMTVDCTRYKQRLEKHIYVAFPELLTYCKGGMPKWVPRLLERYPCAERIAGLRFSTLTKMKGLTEEKAKKIIGKAKQTVAQPTDILLQRTIQQLSKDISDRTKKIEQEKAFLAASFSHPWVEVLESIKGVGTYTAIASTLEIEDIERFESSAAIACYFGLHPVFKVSGDGKNVPRMSKQGRARFRGVLYMAARNLVIHNPYFKEIFAKFKQKGMGYNAAIGVLMHKLLRVMYGMLKNGQKFDPKVDEKNRQRDREPVQAAREGAIEKISEAIEAPISRRAFKKIKEQYAAVEHCADLKEEVSLESKNLNGQKQKAEILPQVS